MFLYIYLCCFLNSVNGSIRRACWDVQDSGLNNSKAAICDSLWYRDLISSLIFNLNVLLFMKSSGVIWKCDLLWLWREKVISSCYIFIKHQVAFHFCLDQFSFINVLTLQSRYFNKQYSMQVSEALIPITGILSCEERADKRWGQTNAKHK